jgi:hypothetical protein
VALTTHPHLAPRLKKEWSYTSIPLWAFVAGYRVNFTFTFIIIIIIIVVEGECVCKYAKYL